MEIQAPAETDRNFQCYRKTRFVSEVLNHALSPLSLLLSFSALLPHDRLTPAPKQAARNSETDRNPPQINKPGRKPRRSAGLPLPGVQS